jgi:hypothetical protein
MFREQQQLESLEKSLNPPLYDEELERLKEDHCQNTGEWLFKGQQYQRWEGHSRADQPHSILWLSGIPGAGRPLLHTILLQFTKNKN